MHTFSVIIPTYNSAGTIDACLQSIFRQVYPDYEIIIVDGASKDDTVEKVKEYSDERLTIVSEKDAGIFDAMNKGVARASGQWLYFLGSDDELYNEQVLQQVHGKIVKHPESKFVYGDVITENGVERYTNYRYTDLVPRCICHQSIFYDRELFNEMKYDLKYKVCADWDLNLKIYRRDIHPVYMDMIVARFNLTGVSGQWMHHPEYLEHFADKKAVVRRYRGPGYLYGYYYPYKAMQLLRKKILWMFR